MMDTSSFLTEAVCLLAGVEQNGQNGYFVNSRLASNPCSIVHSCRHDTSITKHYNFILIISLQRNGCRVTDSCLEGPINSDILDNLI